MERAGREDQPLIVKATLAAVALVEALEALLQQVNPQGAAAARVTQEELAHKTQILTEVARAGAVRLVVAVTAGVCLSDQQAAALTGGSPDI
jgi:hypothetical protein